MLSSCSCVFMVTLPHMEESLDRESRVCDDAALGCCRVWGSTEEDSTPHRSLQLVNRLKPQTLNSKLNTLQPKPRSALGCFRARGGVLSLTLFHFDELSGVPLCRMGSS